METTKVQQTTQAIKFSKDELDKFKVIERKYQETIFKLGQGHLEQLDIEEQLKVIKENEEKLVSEYLSIQKEERDFLTELASKYGEGELSLIDGTFTPAKKA